MADTRKSSVQDLPSGQQNSTQTSTSGSRRLQPQRTQRTTTGIQRYGNESLANPFHLFRRMSDEMEQFFDRALSGGYTPSRNDPSTALGTGSWTSPANWAPRIEAFQRGDQFIVRAELPGLKREDVRVNVTDDSLIIEGERRDEFENTHGDVYHTERSYGSFYREVSLPEGTLSDNAEASFKDGVLEVKLQAPPNEVRRGRAVEVK
jgi:HSP20 family protein